MLRITRFRMDTKSMSCSYARNAASVPSVVAQPVPSRIAPYSPTKVFPVFGVIGRFTGCTPALRQNVVGPGCRLTTEVIEVPGQMSTALIGQVTVGRGPYTGGGGTGTG